MTTSLIGIYDLGELLDGGTTLAASIDSSGVPAQVGASGVRDDEMCATTPSGQLQPYASEYEGYMGNYGNTMDRWYRRGAVVMWPHSHDFAVRAQGSPRWALDALCGLLREKDLAGARERTGSLAPFWADVAGRQLESDEQVAGDGAELGTALDVAFELDDAPLATMLLRPFWSTRSPRGKHRPWSPPPTGTGWTGFGNFWPSGRPLAVGGATTVSDVCGSLNCPRCVAHSQNAVLGMWPGISLR